MVLSAGMPDMIANSFEEYIDIACTLISDPALHRDARARAARARDTSPLFQPEMHARALEAAYRLMAEIQIAGAPPRHFAVGNARAQSGATRLSAQ
jgi:predicted O-linked N-acetylglucosamine transferase (SPINDLY family)